MLFSCGPVRVLAVGAVTVGWLGLSAPAQASGANPDWFTTPSGNISCAITVARAVTDTSEVRCDIADRTFTPPPEPPRPSKDCFMGPWAESVSLARGGPAKFRCISDTVAKQELPVLNYGEETSVGVFRCLSERTGVTCTDTSTGNGFRLARESYRFF